MLKELMDVFEQMLGQYGERLILDEYVPKNGTYRLIVLTEEEYRVEHTLDIRYESKTGTIIGKEDSKYELICYMDYWSKIIGTNKSLEIKKKIHTNNYLSFAVKKESIKENKLTDEIIKGYYDVFKYPENKYKKPKAKALYELTEELLGAVDEELLEQIQKIIKDGAIWEGIDYSKKDYCKLFFIFEDEDKTRKLYEQEGKRYLIPNIYNSNDFNEIDGDEIVGLPNNNMGMNAKKPYLANRTRKVSVPYLLNQSDVLLQGQLFDYLMGLASKNLVNIYISPESRGRKIRGYKDNEEADKVSFGYYLRIRKGKELEILQWDTLQGYAPELKEPFIFRNIMNILIKESDKEKTLYGKECDSLWQIKGLIDSVFFEGRLSNNFFTEASDIPIADETIKKVLLGSRERLFSWFRKGNVEGIEVLLEKMTMKLILNSIYREEVYRARRQFNLRWSLEDYFNGDRGKELLMGKIRKQLREHINMKEEWEFSDEEEFCYAAGQLASYLVSLSKAKVRRTSLLNPLLNAKDCNILKKELEKLLKKYNYNIEYSPNGRAYKLISHVMSYKGEGKLATEQIIAGFTAENLVYEKKESEEETNE